MRATLRAALGGTAALILTTSASANYVGLTLTGQAVNINGVWRQVYRVYAQFTNANDYLTVVYGAPTGSTMSIVSRNATDTGPGSNFFRTEFSHGTAPTPTDVYGGFGSKTTPIPPTPNASYDTFFTIGTIQGYGGSGPNGADLTGYQNMPLDFINGNSFTNNNAGWFTNGPQEQGRAGWMGDLDPQLRVLIMQLTVSSTSTVRGTVNIAGVNANLSGGEGTNFNLSGQTFGVSLAGPPPIPPTPGTLALLGVAGLMGKGRRRA